MSGDIQAGPLAPAAADDEHHAGPLPQAARPQVYRMTERERRWARKRRRRATENFMGLILVPLILLCCYWGVKGGLNALGTSPTALIQGLQMALSQAGKL